MQAYITSDEYAAYGLTAGAGTDRAVASASALIDGYLVRPAGLIWSSDASGKPCFMTRASAVRTWNIQADIEPGADVSVALDTAPSADILGEALVLDAPTPDHCEAVVITSIDGNVVTFGTVERVHSVTSPISSGLVISERRLVGYQCPVAFLSWSPVARMIAVGSRWDSSTRREPSLSDPHHAYFEGFGTGIGPAPIGGVPPQWSLIEPSIIDCDFTTGKLSVHTVSARSEVRACYLAGYSQDRLPDNVKQACAKIAVSILSADPDLPANFKMYRAGDTAIQRFAASVIDSDTQRLLAPYGASRGL